GDAVAALPIGARLGDPRRPVGLGVLLAAAPAAGGRLGRLPLAAGDGGGLPGVHRPGLTGLPPLAVLPLTLLLVRSLRSHRAPTVEGTVRAAPFTAHPHGVKGTEGSFQATSRSLHSSHAAAPPRPARRHP